MENEKEFKPEIVPIKEIIFKEYLPYWPYFILSVMISLFWAYAYLRYQVPQYQVFGTMLIKPEKEGVSSMLEKVVGGQTGMNTANNINDKLFVLRSNKIRVMASKLAKLQVRIESKGRVGGLENFDNLPK